MAFGKAARARKVPSGGRAQLAGTIQVSDAPEKVRYPLPRDRGIRPDLHAVLTDQVRREHAVDGVPRGSDLHLGFRGAFAELTAHLPHDTRRDEREDAGERQEESEVAGHDALELQPAAAAARIPDDDIGEVDVRLERGARSHAPVRQRLDRGRDVQSIHKVVLGLVHIAREQEFPVPVAEIQCLDASVDLDFSDELG